MPKRSASGPNKDTQASTMNKTLGQSGNSYTRNRGASVAGRTLDEQQKIMIKHTVPTMTDAERAATEKRIGADLYEVFLRIQEILKDESEN